MVAKNFNVYFADRQFNIKGMASTAVPFALQIFDDKEVDNLETHTTELSMSIEYPKGYEIDSVLDIGCYILYQDEDGHSKFFTVIDYEKFAAERLIEVYAESGNLDLLNTVALPYEADKAYSISHYINKFAGNSGFEIGVNEVEHLSRKLTWEGEDTATKRVLSVCTQFDNAELDYAFEVTGMTVTKKLINIYKKRGKETGVTLRLYKELNEITTSKSIRNLATGLWATGGTPEGKDAPVNLVGHKYDDGRFYVEDGYLLDRQSFAIWNRFGVPSEKSTVAKHITKTYSNEKAMTQTELRNRAITELTKLSEVEINFTVDIAVLPEGVRVGDTLSIASIDDQLFLGARVLQMEKSRSNKKNIATLGEYLIKHSGITQRVKDMAEQITNMKDGDSSFLWIRYADDDAGNGISAVPTNKEYVAVKSVINNPVPSDDPADYTGLWRKFVGESGIDGTDKFTWIRYADTVSGTGISASPTGKKYIGFAYNKDSANATNNPADYQWFLAKGEDGQKGKDGEDGEDGKNGTDGQTTYFYIAWADSIDGKTGFTINSSQSANKGYLGTYSSTSSTQSTTPASYSWIKLAGAFEEQIKQLEANITAVPKVMVQPTAPRFPEPNMQWWKTKSAVSNDIIGYFKWDGSKWQEQTIQQSLLNIVELNAVEINGSVISGSSFLNYWDKTATNGRKGITKIEKGQVRIDYTTANGIGYVSFDDASIQSQLKNNSGKLLSGYTLNEDSLRMVGEKPLSNGKQQSAAYKRDGITMTDETQPYGNVNLTYKDLLLIGKTPLIPATGWDIYSSSATNQPTARRNGKTIILSGAFKNLKSVNTQNGAIIMGYVPDWAVPASDVNFVVQGTGMNRYLLYIRTNGVLEVERYGVTDHVTAGVGSWFNLSCVYIAGD